MTANKRIFLNIVATYGRSLYALVLGLFSARWVLMSLGEVDYGLFGLVGGLVTLVSFLNSLLAGAVGRYYAFAVGQAKADPISGLEECRKWFNTALTIHTVLPMILVIVGYPVGVWAVEHFLTIPADRVSACLWVWRFSCLSCFIGMVSVPFNAMYGAKQEIAEMTMFGVASTTVNFGFLCYMITHPGDWLVRYSVWTCFISVLPTTIMGMRAILVYSECRIQRKYLGDLTRIKDLLSFAAGRLLCALALMLQGQGRAILVNKILGPAKNAAMTVGQNLTGQATTLTFSMQGAFSPAVTNAYGAGDHDLARILCFRICKFGTLSILVFAAPLIAESDNVLRIWLMNPPPGAAVLCSLLLVEHCLSRLVDGHWMIVFANGKTAGFNATECVGYFIAFVLMWFFLSMGFGISSVGLGLIACAFYTIPVKLYYAKKFGGMSIRYWLVHVAGPLCFVSIVAILVAQFVRYLLPATFGRIVLTTLVCEVVIATLAWIIVFDVSEKHVVGEKFFKMLSKIYGGNRR